MKLFYCLLLASLVPQISLSTAYAQGVSESKLVLKGYDQFVREHDPIYLRAKLEKVYSWWFHPDQKNKTIEFWLDDILLGEAKTNEDGVAELAVNELPEGDYWFEVTYPQASSRGEHVQDRFLVRVREASTSIAISDIDHTVSDSTPWEVVSKGIEEIPPLVGASRVLSEITEDLDLIYLTGRDDSFLLKTRSWLDYWHFPRAPAYFWDFLGDNPNDHGQFKSELIAQLRSRFQNIRVGFGDKPHDAIAYLENGLRAYILNEGFDSSLPKEVIQVRTWSEIKDHLEDNPL